jgi:hypothetical protein
VVSGRRSRRQAKRDAKEREQQAREAAKREEAERKAAERDAARKTAEQEKARRKTEKKANSRGARRAAAKQEKGRARQRKAAERAAAKRAKAQARAAKEQLTPGPTPAAVAPAAGSVTPETAEPTKLATDERPRKPPVYWRVLRLHHVQPNAWQRAVLIEGVLAVGVVLVLAGKATAWTIPVLPVVVAVLVKLNDILAGALSGSKQTNSKETRPKKPAATRPRPKPKQKEAKAGKRAKR